MKQSVEVLGVTQTTGRLKQIALEYRLQIAQCIGQSINNIRILAAGKYIIPRRVGHVKSMRELYKKQPTHPTMLTSRTGWLVATLKKVPNWSGVSGSRRFTMGDERLKTTISVDTPGTAIEEKYRATLYTTPGLAVQKLFRFKWETTGIRGKWRKFMEPAYKDYQPNFESLFRKKVKAFNTTENV